MEPAVYAGRPRFDFLGRQQRLRCSLQIARHCIGRNQVFRVVKSAGPLYFGDERFGNSSKAAGGLIILQADRMNRATACQAIAVSVQSKLPTMPWARPQPSLVS